MEKNNPSFSANDFYNRLNTEKPDWVEGSISASDARFLCESILKAETSTAIEIGTGAGFSTAILCQALSFGHTPTSRFDSDFQVISYDARSYFSRDRTKKIGQATTEMLVPELQKHIVFRNPATARDLKSYHGENEINFLFVDANHKHPWPTLDLIATLDLLTPGAMVVLHDINLPLINPEFPDWGAKYLFHDIEVEKEVPEPFKIRNIGRFKIPEDKTHFRRQLLNTLFTHEWQCEIKVDYLTAVGVNMEDHYCLTHN